MSSITFLSSCKGKKYSRFILPFLFSTLKTSENSYAEIIVDDVEVIYKRYDKALQVLENLFGKRFVFVPYDSKYTSILPCGATARYYTIPTIKSEYTLVSDLDIFYTEKNIEKYYDNLFKTQLIGMPYTSIKRQGKDKMAGTFCVRTEMFYTEDFQKNVDMYFDEVKNGDLFRKKVKPFDIPQYNEFVNYSIISRTFRLPTKEMNENPSVYRKIHGIHTSLNRPARPLPPPNHNFPHWGLTEEKIEEFKAIDSTDYYKSFYNFFDEEYKEIISEFHL